MLCAIALALCCHSTRAAQPAEPDELFFDDDMLDAIEQEVLSLLPARSSAGFSIGRDNAGNMQTSASLQLAVTQEYWLDVGLSQSNINDVTPAYTTRAFNLGAGSNYSSAFNWYAGVSKWGKDGTIETADALLELSLHKQGWLFTLQLQQGDVTLYLDPLFANRRPSISSARSAWGIRIGHDTGGGRWWLSWLQRDYERDVSRIGSSALLQRVLQNIALDQAYALTREELAAGYQWYWQQSDLRIEVSTTTSAVDDQRSDFGSLWYRYQLNSTWTIATGIQKSLQQNFVTLNAGVYIAW